jgi:hypothetical protein
MDLSISRLFYLEFLWLIGNIVIKKTICVRNPKTQREKNNMTFFEEIKDITEKNSKLKKIIRAAAKQGERFVEVKDSVIYEDEIKELVEQGFKLSRKEKYDDFHNYVSYAILRW